VIEQIKSSLRILELLSRCGVPVNRGGFISSPGREEKTPSCKIYPKSDSFYDFSTSKGGDVIDLYCLLYNKERKQGIAELFSMIGGKYSPAPQLPPNQLKKRMELDLNVILSDEEKEIYYERFGMTDDGTYALNQVKHHRMEQNKEVFEALYSFCLQIGWELDAKLYMNERRKLCAETLQQFKCFFIKDYKRVSEYLKQKFGKDRLIRSGLFNEKVNLIFFRHRIMISYLHMGKIVYLRGRYYGVDGEKEKAPSDASKYIGLRDDGLGVNTPRRFYNWDVVASMGKGEKLYIVEGEFDTMVMAQMGYNCIGVPGTGTVNLEKLDRLTGFEVVIMVDSDEPGKKLQAKLIKRFAELGKQVAIKALPNKDITDFVVQYG